MSILKNRKKKFGDVPLSVLMAKSKPVQVSLEDMSFWAKLKYHIFDTIGLCFAFLLSVFVRVFFLFVPMEYRGVEKLRDYVENKGPVILVFWHGRAIYVIKFWLRMIGFRKHPIYGIFSTHRDGKFIGRILVFLGGKKISTNRKNVNQGKKTAIESLKILRKGYSLGFTPDGPVGPRMNFVTDSAFLFAKSSGAPIVPVCASSLNAKLLNSWDRFMFAKPFHKTVVSVGDFLFVPKNIGDAEFKKLKADFEKRMVRETQKLDAEMKMPLVEPDDGFEKEERWLKKLRKWGEKPEVIDALEKDLNRRRLAKRMERVKDENKSSNN